MTNIAQLKDADGNPFYPKTHVSAVEGYQNIQDAILTSPNGSQYKIKVNDDGTLTTEQVITGV
jgi:hypothetical protein